MKFILGQKIGMSQIFDEEGNQVPVTLIEAGPCEVTQIKTKEKDKYTAIQIGFKKIEKKKKIRKTMKKKPFRYLREFSARGGFLDVKKEAGEFRVGQKIDASVFKEGDVIEVSGISKGKGFAGGVKRWGFAGRPKTRGTKHEERTIGSIGATPPSRVIKGKKMPGRMGAERVTVKGLKIVKVDSENNLLMVKGAVPGAKGTLLEIRSEK